MLTEKSSAPELDSRLRAVWRDVLGTDEVTERANFFSTGGTSLLAGKLIVLVNREFGTKLALRDIFIHSNFEDFAAHVSAQRSKLQKDRPDDPGEELGQLQPSPMQERRLRQIGRAAKDGWVLPNWLCGIVCELESPVTDDAIEDAINALVSRHDALRSGFRFTPDGDTCESFVSPSATVELERILLPGPSLILRHVAEILDEPLSLSEPPLVRARLCRFSENHATLILAVDHLVCDGTSADLIFDELAAALSGTLVGRPQALQYSEWVRRQHAQLTWSRREDLLRFWRGALGGSLPYPDLGLPAPPPRHARRGSEPAASLVQTQFRRDLPGHRASGPEPIEASEDQIVHVTATDLNRVRSAIGPLGITIFMATMGCIARAWQIMTNHKNMVIHTPVDNRSMSGADTVVGWLSHAVVLRLPLDGEQADWPGRLSAIRNLVLDALAHQELPLSEVLKDVQPEAYNPAPRRPRLFYQYNNVKRRRLPITGGVISDWVPADDFTWTDAGIAFIADEDCDGCKIRLIFDHSAVDPSFANALRSHIDEAWQDLLAAMAERPNQG
jgi:Condensation domain/Phosphopantetheine attachment site